MALGLLLLAAEGCARHTTPSVVPQGPAPQGGSSFVVTAYCKGRTTAAGTKATGGIVAADPSLLPLGSVIGVAGLDDKYNGVYTVLDTGSKVRGRHIDMYIKGCSEALQFGRQSATVSVMRRGWDPSGR